MTAFLAGYMGKEAEELNAASGAKLFGTAGALGGGVLGTVAGGGAGAIAGGFDELVSGKPEEDEEVKEKLKRYLKAIAKDSGKGALIGGSLGAVGGGAAGALGGAVVGDFLGEMNKIAGLTEKGLDKGTDLAGFLARKGGAALLLAPILAGAGAGTIVSKATSPTKMDEDVIQRELEAMELQEFQTELQRRKLVAKKMARKAKDADVAERTLRI
jgi:hypothetical protein